MNTLYYRRTYNLLLKRHFPSSLGRNLDDIDALGLLSCMHPGMYLMSITGLRRCYLKILTFYLAAVFIYPSPC